MKLKFTAAVLLCHVFINVFAQPGTLDSDFSSDGKLTLAFNSSTNNIATCMVIQPNQKIIVAGTYFDGPKFNVAVARINEDGTLDGTFGTGGKFTTSYTLGDAKVNAMALQPDGKILLAGSWYGLLAQETFLIGRLNANGTPDSTFGSTGFITTAINARSVVYALAMQSDSLIVAGGYSVGNGAPYKDFTLVRYKPNGVIDSSFNVDGIVTTDFYGWDDYAKAVTVTSGNKIIVAGNCSKSVGGWDNFAVAKYNYDGTLDVNFAGNGKVDYVLDTYEDEVHAMTLQPDEKIVLAGNGLSAAALMRLKANGERDSTFGSNGYKTFFWDVGDNEIHGMALQPDGKILAAGFGQPSSTRFSIARLNSNGVVDSSFGTNGTNEAVFVDGGTPLRSKALCMALQSDGRVVAAGFSRSSVFDTDTAFAIARFYTGLNLGVLNFSADKKTVSAYPNPVSDLVNLRYTLTQTETVSVRLFDMQGRLITTFAENETQPEGEIVRQFSLPEHISNGNYLLNVVSEKGSISVQLTKP